MKAKILERHALRCVRGSFWGATRIGGWHLESRDRSGAREQHVKGTRGVPLEDQRVRGGAGQDVTLGQQCAHDSAQLSVAAGEPAAHLAPVLLSALLFLADHRGDRDRGDRDRGGWK